MTPPGGSSFRSLPCRTVIHLSTDLAADRRPELHP